MRKGLPALILAAGLLFPATLMAMEPGAAGESWPTVVLPEVTTRIRLSNSDVNRIVCADDIRDVVYSQEKGVVVRIAGKNAFVKFTVTKKGRELLYSETPSELHVVCGEAIYSLVAIPQRVPAQTIQLSTGQKERVRKNLALFEGLPFEKKVLKIVRDTYAEEIPESFVIRAVNRKVDLFQEIGLTLRREIIVEGEGFRVLEYAASLKAEQKELRLSEKAFLRKELTENPVAIAIDEPLLRPGETARIFIVEKKPEGDGWQSGKAPAAPVERPRETPFGGEEHRHVD
jgi:conjugal transfer pilus assembly protein TraK